MVLRPRPEQSRYNSVWLGELLNHAVARLNDQGGYTVRQMLDAFECCAAEIDTAPSASVFAAGQAPEWSHCFRNALSSSRGGGDRRLRLPARPAAAVSFCIFPLHYASTVSASDLTESSKHATCDGARLRQDGVAELHEYVVACNGIRPFLDIGSDHSGPLQQAGARVLLALPRWANLDPSPSGPRRGNPRGGSSVPSRGLDCL